MYYGRDIMYYLGNDKITSDYEDSVYRGTPNSDRIAVTSNRTTVYGGGGNDVICIWGEINDVVYGDAGDDILLTNFAENPTMYGGLGNDTIQIDGKLKRAYAEGGAGNDVFRPVESISGVTLDGGEGDDRFDFVDSCSVTITGGNGKDTYRINPYFAVVNWERVVPYNNIVITDLSEEDVFQNYYDKADGSELNWYKAANGNIVLYDQNYGFFNITLQGVTDIYQVADLVYDSTNRTDTLREIFNLESDTVEPIPTIPAVTLNSAKTAITLTSAYDEETFDVADYGTAILTIDASAVDYDLKINGNAENNRIIGGEGSDCIIGGKGTDCLTGGDGDDIFVYNSGDGNDVITDYTEGKDKIQINGVNISSVINSASLKGSDVVFKAGAGKITVKGGKDKEIIFINASGIEYPYPVPDETVILNAANTAATITENYEDETFDAAYYPASLVTINANEAAVALNIIGNAKGNVIIGSENDDIIEGGKGNDKLTGNDGADIFVYTSGDGNDTIMDYTEGEDTIQINGANVETVISSATVKGSDVIFKVGTGKITVKGGGDGKEILFVDEDGNEYTYPNGDEGVEFNASSTSATVTAYYEDETFDAEDYPNLVTINATEATVDLEILGNAKNNKIYGSENNDTLYGGKGTDTLTGNGGDDTFHIVKGEGNKVIADYTEGEDIIYVEGADVETVINSASVKSGNVIFKVGTNNVTVKGGDGQEILFTDEDGNEYTYPNPDTDPEPVLFNASSTSATVTAYYEDETFDAADYSKLVTIDATEAAVDLEILGNAKNNKIYGSENNDTLYGGKGTDTLTGNGGDDTFHIVKGEGNKVIADYNEGEDLIYVEGANVETVIDSASVKSGNVIFKVGTNNVTVKGGSGQEILFVDEDGEEYTYSAGASGRSALWFTEDDTNFISDTPQLDAISEPKYSVVTYPETSSEIFAQNNQDTIIAVSDR